MKMTNANIKKLITVVIKLPQANKIIPPPAVGPSDVDLLTEIRDELRKK